MTKIRIRKDNKVSLNRMRPTLIALAIYGLVFLSSLGLAMTLHLASASLPDSSITMVFSDSKPIDARIKQLVERQANAWETANPDKIVADFAEDSVFIVPGSTFRGKQEIKKAAEGYFAEYTDTKVKIKRIIANGNEVAVEWSWSERNKETGKNSQAEDAIIFELEEGKIKYWREYIDKESRGN